MAWSMRRVATMATALSITATLAVPVTAGSLEEGVYHSGHGYSVTPPEEWRVVDRGNQAIAADDMPAPLAKAPVDGYDVMFYDASIEPPEGDDAPEPIFDNIFVVVVPSVPTADADTANGLASAVKPELEKLFAEVELQRAEVGKHNGTETIDLEWSVAGEGDARKGFVLQSIRPATAKSVMVTCSFGIDRAETFRDTCNAVLDSVSVED